MNPDQFSGLTPTLNWTWGELAEFIETPFVAKGAGRASRAVQLRDSSFNELKDWPALVNAATHGWPEGLALVSRALAAATASNRVSNVRRASERYDVGGERPHVPLACAGDPKSMIRKGPMHLRMRPTVRVLFNVVSSGVVDKRRLANRGAAVLAWCDAIEAAGYSTEIVTVWCTRSGESIRGTFRVTIKEAGDKFDLDRLSFALACPDYMRRAMFALCEACEGLNGMTSDSYGTPTQVIPDAGQAYIPAVYGGTVAFSTPELAAENIRGILAGVFPHLLSGPEV